MSTFFKTFNSKWGLDVKPDDSNVKNCNWEGSLGRMGVYLEQIVRHDSHYDCKKATNDYTGAKSQQLICCSYLSEFLMRKCILFYNMQY